MLHLSQNFFYVYKKSMDTYYMELILIGGELSCYHIFLACPWFTFSNCVNLSEPNLSWVPFISFKEMHENALQNCDLKVDYFLWVSLDSPPGSDAKFLLYKVFVEFRDSLLNQLCPGIQRSD